jgi:GT2 family glycosyltransferase
MKPDVTISLISLNQRSDLNRLLPTLREAARQLSSEILLVDNRSQDASGDFVRQNFPEIQVFSNPKKSGYGENHNINLGRAEGRYCVIMNSDMTVATDVFVVLRDYMDQHTDVGIVAPKILNPDGTPQGLNKRYPTLWDLVLRRFMPKRLRPLFQRRMDYYEMRDVGYDRECEVSFLSGAFMFCRSDLIKKLCGFDPRYFLYFEDADLSRRVQQTHRTVYYPATAVTHYWERAAHKNWKFTWIFMQSAWRYFNRWGWKLF